MNWWFLGRFGYLKNDLNDRYDEWVEVEVLELECLVSGGRHDEGIPSVVKYWLPPNPMKSHMEVVGNSVQGIAKDLLLLIVVWERGLGSVIQDYLNSFGKYIV